MSDEELAWGELRSALAERQWDRAALVIKCMTPDVQEVMEAHASRAALRLGAFREWADAYRRECNDEGLVLDIGPSGFETSVYYNGQEMMGVTSLTVRCEAGEVTRVTLDVTPTYVRVRQRGEEVTVIEDGALRELVEDIGEEA
jgi:hypothetical protein